MDLHCTCYLDDIYRACNFPTLLLATLVRRAIVRERQNDKRRFFVWTGFERQARQTERKCSIIKATKWSGLLIGFADLRGTLDERGRSSKALCRKAKKQRSLTQVRQVTVADNLNVN